jgi:hypothetical protein
MTKVLIPKARSTQAHWRAVLPVHPAAELFPPMSDAELHELGDDIKRNGLRNPVTIHVDDKGVERLLDGCNRLDAMEKAGLAIVSDGIGDLNPDVVQIQSVQGNIDPIRYVLSVNIHRRHLTADQKRDLIAKVLKANPEGSNRQIAEQLKVDHHKVASVRAEREATGEIPPVEKTKGKDGKKRRVHQRRIQTGKVVATEATKSGASTRVDPSRPINPTEPVGGKGIGFASLHGAWREVEAQWAAGNETRLKGALQRLLKEVSAALAKVRS